MSQEIFQPSARCQALAEVSSPLSDCWSAFGNQAGLAGITKPEAGGSFQNRFLVSELSSSAGLLVLPVQSSVFAVSIYQFGKIPFRQEKFGLAYSRKLMPQLNFGVQFNYYRLFLSEDNRSAGVAGLELGIQYFFNQRLVAGMHVVNPFRTGIKLYSGNFNFASLINIGTLYQLSDSFSLMAELENNFEQRFRIKAAMEYRVLNKFFLRIGTSGKPMQLSAGIGFQVNKLTIDLASAYNQYLGNSPSVSFKYQF
jgi:hypothetical protein